jgi:hypothetical protein
MAVSNVGAEDRQFERRFPDLSQFPDGWVRPLAEQRAAESDHAHRHDQCGTHPHPAPGGLGGLLEHSPAAIITAIYVIIGLAVCVFYNLNFVYIFLVISNLILAFVRLLIFWQLRRNPWIMWFVATNIGKATAFFLAFMVIFKPELAAEIRPWLRLVWLTVFVFISIGAGDKAAELAHFLHMKREIYKHD